MHPLVTLTVSMSGKDEMKRILSNHRSAEDTKKRIRSLFQEDGSEEIGFFRRCTKQEDVGGIAMIVSDCIDIHEQQRRSQRVPDRAGSLVPLDRSLETLFHISTLTIRHEQTQSDHFLCTSVVFPSFVLLIIAGDELVV